MPLRGITRQRLQLSRHPCWMNDGTMALTTPRLRLVAATPAIVVAELEGHERLAELLAATLLPDSMSLTDNRPLAELASARL
jgi:hypothetical protein